MRVRSSSARNKKGYDSSSRRHWKIWRQSWDESDRRRRRATWISKARRRRSSRSNSKLNESYVLIKTNWRENENASRRKSVTKWKSFAKLKTMNASDLKSNDWSTRSTSMTSRRSFVNHKLNTKLIWWRRRPSRPSGKGIRSTRWLNRGPKTRLNAWIRRSWLMQIWIRSASFRLLCRKNES